MMCGARSGRARRWAVSCAGALFAVLSALSFQGTAAVAAEKSANKSDVNFWVISSRSCPLGTKVVNGAGFDYLRYDQDGTPSWGDEKQFHASLSKGAPVCVLSHIHI